MMALISPDRFSSAGYGRSDFIGLGYIVQARSTVDRPLIGFAFELKDSGVRFR